MEKRAINLGCGITTAPGWFNLDNSPNARLSKYPWLKWMVWKLGLISDMHYNTPFDKNIIVQDLTKPLPFETNSINYVYTSHFLEHTSFDDAKKVLKDCHRVLKPGGIARIIVPDLKFHIQQYLDGVNQFTTEIPFDNAADCFMYEMRTIGKSRDPHLWMYDEKSLVQRMNEAGFKNVQVCEFKKGRCIDIDILDNRPDNSLIVEGEK
jgi:predicted SAM-dependent methyltransferase